MRDVTHFYVWHASCIGVWWLIHICDATQSSVFRDSFTLVTRLIHTCAMTHPRARHANKRTHTHTRSHTHTHTRSHTHTYLQSRCAAVVLFHSSEFIYKIMRSNSHLNPYLFHARHRLSVSTPSWICTTDHPRNYPPRFGSKYLASTSSGMEIFRDWIMW